MEKKSLILVLGLVFALNFSFLSAEEFGYNLIEPAATNNVTTFLGLTDTPGTYSGQAGNCAKVNSSENGLEFGSCGGGGGEVNQTITYTPSTGNVTLDGGGGSFIISTFNATYDAYNSTGLIIDWNSTGLIINWSKFILLVPGLNTSGDYIFNDSKTIFFNTTLAETNLSVNKSNFWDGFNFPNETTFEEQLGGVLGINITWLTDFINSFDFITQTFANNTYRLKDNHTFNGDVQIDGGDLNVSTGEIFVNEFNVSLAIANSMSSGIVDGGFLTIGTDPAKFDVSASKSWFVNNSDPIPNLQYVECPAFDEVTITNLLTADRTDVALQRDCTLVQKTTNFNNEERRSKIVLGRIVHPNNINITITVDLQHYVPGIYDQWLDFTHAIGNLNTNGNVYSAASTDLSMNRTSGRIFRIGSNYVNNKDNPNEVAQNSESNVSFFYRFQDGSGGFSQSAGPTTQVDVSQYDDGSGTLASVPNNRFAITRVFLFSDNATVLQYGQALYSKLSEATAAITTEDFNEDPNLQTDSVLRAWVVARGNTVDLSDVAKVKIVTAGKFGTLGGGAGTSSAQEVDLQDAYDNSLEPEITLNAVNFGLTIQDAPSALGVPLFEIKNNDTQSIFNVSVANLAYEGNFNLTGNQTLGQKITFALGEFIDNIVNGWVRVTGGLNVTGDTLLGSVNISGSLNFTNTETKIFYNNGIVNTINGSGWLLEV